MSNVYQLPIAEHNKIWRDYICDVDYDGHIFECYGSNPANGEPEVEQIAFKGLMADVTDLLDKRITKHIDGVVEQKWLSGVWQEDQKTFVRELCSGN